MSNFLALLKIQFYTNFKINKLAKRNLGKKVGSIGGVLLYGLFFAFIIGFVGYNYTTAFIYSLADRPEEIITIIIAITAIFSFMFSFYSMTSVLYNFKDYDMLISMPIKKSSIVFSKLAYSFITDFLLSIIIVVGALIKLNEIPSYYLDSAFISKIVFLTLISPLFSLTLSLIIGTLFAYIASRFKRKNIIQTILFLFFFIAYMAISLLSSNENYDLTKPIGKVFFIYPLLNSALNDSTIYVIYYVLACVVPFVFFAILVCCFYGKLNSIFSAKRTSRKFKLKKYSGKSELHTLFNKEFKRLMSSSIYAVNTLLGSILGIVMCIVFIAIFVSLDLGLDGLSDAILVFGAMALVFTFMLSPTTNCSIALEGKCYWLIKTSPIKPKTWFFAKLLLNGVFYTPIAFLIGISLSIAVKASIFSAVIFTAFSVMLSLLSGILGLFANILFPHLTWENENQAVKQGASTFITVFVTLIMLALFFLAFNYITLEPLWILIIYLSFVTLLTAILYYIVFFKGEKILEKRIK